MVAAAVLGWRYHGILPCLSTSRTSNFGIPYSMGLSRHRQSMKDVYIRAVVEHDKAPKAIAGGVVRRRFRPSRAAARNWRYVGKGICNEKLMARIAALQPQQHCFCAGRLLGCKIGRYFSGHRNRGGLCYIRGRIFRNRQTALPGSA